MDEMGCVRVEGSSEDGCPDRPNQVAADCWAPGSQAASSTCGHSVDQNSDGEMASRLNSMSAKLLRLQMLRDLIPTERSGSSPGCVTCWFRGWLGEGSRSISSTLISLVSEGSTMEPPGTIVTSGSESDTMRAAGPPEP